MKVGEYKKSIKSCGNGGLVDDAIFQEVASNNFPIVVYRYKCGVSYLSHNLPFPQFPPVEK